MKHDIMICARVTPWMKELIEELAVEDERTLSWTVRKLLVEALDARGLVQGSQGASERQDLAQRRRATVHHHPFSKQ